MVNKTKVIYVNPSDYEVLSKTMASAGLDMLFVANPMIKKHSAIVVSDEETRIKLIKQYAEGKLCATNEMN